MRLRWQTESRGTGLSTVDPLIELLCGALIELTIRRIATQKPQLQLDVHTCGEGCGRRLFRKVEACHRIGTHTFSKANRIVEVLGSGEKIGVRPDSVSFVDSLQAADGFPQGGCLT